MNHDFFLNDNSFTSDIFLFVVVGLDNSGISVSSLTTELLATEGASNFGSGDDNGGIFCEGELVLLPGDRVLCFGLARNFRLIVFDNEPRLLFGDSSVAFCLIEGNTAESEISNPSSLLTVGMGHRGPTYRRNVSSTLSVVVSDICCATSSMVK